MSTCAVRQAHAACLWSKHQAHPSIRGSQPTVLRLQLQYPLELCCGSKHSCVESCRRRQANELRGRASIRPAARPGQQHNNTRLRGVKGRPMEIMEYIASALAAECTHGGREPCTHSLGVYEPCTHPTHVHVRSSPVRPPPPRRHDGSWAAGRARQGLSIATVLPWSPQGCKASLVIRNNPFRSSALAHADQLELRVPPAAAAAA